MNPNLNDNPCVCCGEYAVEGSWLCWRCQQQVENYLKDEKELDKKNKV